MRSVRVFRASIMVIALGCAGLPRAVFEAPAVEVVSLELTGLDLSGGALSVRLAIHNPNPYRIRSTRLEVALALEDTQFGNVVLESPLDLPGGETVPVELPLSFTWAGVGAGARSLLSQGSVRYLLTGRMVVGTPVGDRGVALRRAGELEVRDLVK